VHLPTEREDGRYATADRVVVPFIAAATASEPIHEQTDEQDV
jgi:hypothetical protein